LTDALGAIGLPSPLALLGLGMGLPEKKVRTKRVLGGALVPPSVPVDRVATAGTGVPMSILSPNERQVMGARLAQEKPFKQGPGMLMSSNTMRTGNASKYGTGSGLAQGGGIFPFSSFFGSGLSLKEMLAQRGIKMPTGMRDKKAGSKISKAQYEKLKAHLNKRKDKGGNFWDSFKEGFMLPFQAIGSVI
jgi:hypothetical protein